MILYTMFEVQVLEVMGILIMVIIMVIKVQMEMEEVLQVLVVIIEVIVRMVVKEVLERLVVVMVVNQIQFRLINLVGGMIWVLKFISLFSIKGKNIVTYIWTEA